MAVLSVSDAQASAFLSWAAYSYSHNVQDPIDGHITTIAHSVADNLLNSGWTALTNVELGLPTADFNAQGFFDVDHTQAIVVVKGSTIALAIRGSDDLLPPNDWVAALNTDSQNSQFTRYQDLLPLLDAVSNYITTHASDPLSPIQHFL